MTGLWFKHALLPDGWADDVRVEIADGRVVSVQAGAAPGGAERVDGVALPGLGNAHSHAFQRGMAGLAERRGTHHDTFWTWRETMYRFALTMDPEDVEAIAAQLYVEMLEAGFTRVGEFHYLHHDGDGRPYADVAEMASRIAAAAEASGIGLTLLPVFYAHSDFGAAPPLPEQRRFICDIDLYARLWEASHAPLRDLPGSILGHAPHSLRAATPEEIESIIELAPEALIHMHIAEQEKEVRDCLAWSRARPVALLLHQAEVGGRWCLVHATHMDDDEAFRLAGSGATVSLCPVTEANLGDGIFDAPRFVKNRGRTAIGTDSNILIGVADELRQLEYSQRLRDRSRNVMAEDGGSTGRALFEAALAGGAAALGTGSAAIAAGAAADIITLDPEHQALMGKSGDALLDAWIFAAGNEAIDCVFVRGEKLVSGRRHRRREPIRRRFDRAMARLTA
jgi:formimidoylglutamate deiminase